MRNGISSIGDAVNALIIKSFAMLDLRRSFCSDQQRLLPQQIGL